MTTKLLCLALSLTFSPLSHADGVAQSTSATEAGVVHQLQAQPNQPPTEDQLVNEFCAMDDQQASYTGDITAVAAKGVDGHTQDVTCAKTAKSKVKGKSAKASADTDSIFDNCPDPRVQVRVNIF